MSNSLVPIDPQLLVLIHGAFDGNGELKPFAREIMLIECHVAGTGYRDLQDIEPNIAVGSFLPLRREPENKHDSLAIMILDERGHHLGYVPRAKNEAIARLMDAGKLMFARLEGKAWHDAWLNLEIRVFMRDW